METIKSSKLTTKNFNICCDTVLPAIESLGPICKAKYYANILLYKGVTGGNNEDIAKYKNNIERIGNIITNYYITKYAKQYNNGEFNDTIGIIDKMITYSRLSFKEYINIFGFIDILKGIEGFDYIKYAKAIYEAKVICDNADEKSAYQIVQDTLKDDIEVKKKIKTT